VKTWPTSSSKQGTTLPEDGQAEDELLGLERCGLRSCGRVRNSDDQEPSSLIYAGLIKVGEAP
jgi:hypothetical protein